MANVDIRYLLSLLAEAGLVEGWGEEGGEAQLTEGGVGQLQLPGHPRQQHRGLA